MRVRIRLNFNCDTCGRPVAKRKTFKITFINHEEATKELRPQVAEWKRSLLDTGVDCFTCARVKRSLAEPTSGN